MENFNKDYMQSNPIKNKYSAFNNIYHIHKKSSLQKWLAGFLLLIIIIMFLPWTQNIRAKGYVTTLKQEQRPQQLHAVIPGRIEKWFVKEGDFVKQGDTILKLAEIKEDYFDPMLLERTKEQITAKEISAESYQNKAATATGQMEALENARKLKLLQIDNKLRQQTQKVVSDSMEMIAAINELNIAQYQFNRQKMLFDSGLVSLTQFEQRNQFLQNARAKKTSAEIKFSNAKQELQLLMLEKSTAIQDYNEKILKAEGDRFQSQSQAASSQGEAAKLKNQYFNYDTRRGLYYITAPQSGQITKARKAGIGEIVKEGEMIVEVVPDIRDNAVEMFVKPVDLPLVSIGQEVKLIFDGFPAIVFSGWPQASYGIFDGKVVAVETSVSENGMFRVLIAEDKKLKAWPWALKMGTGANGIALLKDVPIGYELWRNINGFPPEYYIAGNKADTKEKK